MSRFFDRFNAFYERDSSACLNRLYTLILLIANGTLSLSAFAINAAAGLTWPAGLPSLAFAAACATGIAMRGKVTRRAAVGFVCVTAFGYYPHMYFVTGGLDGMFPLCLVMMSLFMAMFFKGRECFGMIALMLLVNACAVAAGALFPGLVAPGLTGTSKLVSRLAAIPVTCAAAAALSSMVLGVYRAEHARVNELMAQLKRTNEELYSLSIRDPLTGIYNRRYFFEALERELQRHRGMNAEMCVLMLDIDLFKLINDAHGHSVGDEILKLLAASVREMLRDHDVFGRYGGEEFVVLLPRCSLRNGVKIAERIREHVAAQRYRREIGFTVSIGVSVLMPGDTGAALVDRADRRLYDAKSTGRNKVVA